MESNQYEIKSLEEISKRKKGGTWQDSSALKQGWEKHSALDAFKHLAAFI